MKKIIWPILAMILITTGGRAQNKLWTFQQCLDTAWQRNISINQSRLSNELNKVSLEQVKANRIPSLSANASEGLNFGKNVDPTTNSYVTQAYHSTNFGVSSSLNLFNGMQNANTIRQNRLNVQAGQYDIEKVKNDVTLNITTGYLQVLFAYEILSAAKSQESATAAQVDRTGKLVNAGKSPESDLLQIKSQLATDNLSVVNAQIQLNLAKVTLMQLMEIPITDNFEVEVPVQTEPPIELGQTNEEIYKKSLEVQPQIASASLKTNASLMALKISEGARWPRLTLGGSLSSNFASSRTKGTAVNPENYPFFTQIWDNIGQSFSLGLSIPIYNNRQIKSNIDRAKINAMTTQLSEQNTKNVLRKSIEQTYTDLRAAMKKYGATKEQLAAVESVYLNAEKKYDVGVMNATDFLIQKNNYTQSQSNLIQAKFDYIFKQKILDFYQGKEIKFN
ncbi:MAG: TolC family protein [Bacteroidales bacterium]|nr:TolC family protein [Bacteroidales bacterium]MDD4602711.1 TolC family protein [Bacteroidales bacterium]